MFTRRHGDSTSPVGHVVALRSLLILACLALFGGVRLQAGSILREVFAGIGGSSLSDLTNNPAYPNSPTSTSLITDFFETPVDSMDDYGQRLRATFVAPVTGNYTFWIASDDASTLFLSTDATPANSRPIASVTSWTPSRSWGSFPEQQSAPIRLVAGNSYYIEALQKEGGGGDNLAVRWLRPDGVDQGPIPLGDFIAWGLKPEAPRISLQPVPRTVIEGGSTSFSVDFSNQGATDIYWRKNGTFIPGERTKILNLSEIPLSDNGARITAFLSNGLGTVTSTEAILTVTPDLVPPQLVRAYNSSLGTIVVEFSKPVRIPSGTPSTFFQVSGGLSISAMAQGDTPQRIALSTSTLVPGTAHTVTVTGVTDRTQSANPVPAGSSIAFVVSELAPVGLGGIGVNATVLRGANAGEYDLTVLGGDFGGTTDTGAFAVQNLSGNFDLRVRVADLTQVDPYAVAGLMARNGTANNAAFAAVFASSSRPGMFFESRSTSGGAAVTTSLRGGFPVNYPFTWLRLRRSGTELAGFGSFDGVRWTQLGSMTASLPTQLSVGLALGGRDSSATARARFRDYGPVVGPQIVSFVPPREGLGVSSRRTRIVFSEVHYNTGPNGPGGASEFIEVFNAGDVFEEMGGWSLVGGVSFQFPAGFRLGAGQFAVIAANPTALSAETGLTGILGPWTGSLNNSGDLIQLRDEQGALRLEMEYESGDPWPVAADGTGHSLILANPSYGEADPRAWSSSARRGGSPGNLDPLIPDPVEAISINEVLAHTDLPLLDYIELYNRSNVAVDLTGHVLTDNITTNRYRFPAGTVLAARGFLVLDEIQLGFRLSAAGESVFLLSPDGRRVLAAIAFGGQENGIALGRHPDGAGELRRMANRTPGAPNGAPRVEDVVINEINYHPITDDDADEFVELHNRSGQSVSLAGWRFESGVSFTFPAGASIPAGGFVVVGGDRDRLLSNHPTLAQAATFGNWSGSLRNSGEFLRLSKPDEVRTTNELGEVSVQTIRIVVGEVSFRDGGRWGKWAEGGGSSLELIDPRADPLRASNWADSDESSKGTWQLYTLTDTLRFGSQTPDAFHVGMLGAGEALIDEVQVLGPGGASLLSNGGFETGSGTTATGWTFAGHHSLSRVESTGAFAGSRALRIVSPGDLDAGRNCVRTTLAAGLNNGVQGTIRVRARWIAGWPEILFRTRGGGLEMTARLQVPTNLGTPGAPNSRRVANAGPAIYQVTHYPTVPAASQPVVVTARLSDPDGISSVNLRTRTSETGAFTSTVMRDDGTGGDSVAGDGIWSATVAGRANGSLVQFRIETFDNASSVVGASFPSGSVFAGSPAVTVANIRWGDPVPFGSFEHVHSWTAPSVDNALGADGLDNTYRDGTLVHGNLRVIYNAGIRRKGSPFTGQADFAMTVPSDDRLLGVTDRVYGLTGNGGEEGTHLRNQMANWIARGMRLPYLNTHYVRFYRNGAPHGSIDEDLEQPSNYFAESWFPDAGEGDLRKIAFWFEFRTDGNFDVVGADLGNYRNPNGQYNLSRYRWNWQGRPTGTTANDFTNFFALVTAANNRATNYQSLLLNVADIDQWMRMFALDAALGNWDTWGVGNNQNKYMYYQPGGRWNLLPWDMDWVLGAGDPATRQLFGGQDDNVNYMFNWPAFRRMAWRAYQEAVDGPFQPARYNPQFTARMAALDFNQVGRQSPQGIIAYMEARREFIRQQIAASDAPRFEITSNNGANFTSATPIATVEGRAPFAAVEIRVNGVTVPTEWLDLARFRLRVPLTAAVNNLLVTGVDRNGNPIAGFSDSITVNYNGVLQNPADFLVINELHYNPAEPGASFIELFNRSANTAFDLSGWRLNGVGYTFPSGSVIPPGTFWVLVRDRAGFSLAYGANVVVFDEFTGSLDNNGERIALVRPTGDSEELITDVRYDNRLPWPTNAAGFGPSLQLIDAIRGSWRVGNWTASATNAANRVTPGRANLGVASLAAFPSVWINEVLPANVAGPIDNAGDREPFIELFNSGATPVDLSGMMLSDNMSNLTAWTFPAGSSIPAGGFLRIWADGEPGETVAGSLHTSFRIHPSTGTIALVRLQGISSTPAVVDYLSWENLPAGRSFGSVPDGEPRSRRILFNPTAGAANDPAVPVVNVVINEFMAQNTRTITDPADGDWDDWIELHNRGSEAVDLAGFYLTDNLTNSITGMFRIPGGYPIPPGGFLLVWADNETGQNVATNSDLHASFALARGGEQVGLFDPTGRLVDGLSFTTQTNDVSLGRFPDGAEPPFYFMESPSPRMPNLLAGANRPPTFNPITDIVAPEQTEVRFTVVATDPDPGQSLVYSLGPDAPAGAIIDPQSGLFRWSTSESDGPAAYSFLLRATDNGSPSRVGAVRVNITVQEVNRPPVVLAVTNVVAAEGSLLSMSVNATDSDIPANVLSFSLRGSAPSGLELSPSGQLTWIPGESFGGTEVEVGYEVTDNGSPAGVASGLIRIAVAEVNNPPEFPQPPPQFLDELATLELTLAATDPEGAPVQFSFDGPPASGATLDPVSGLLRWQPTEAQGPTNAVFLIRATDGSPDRRSVVREVLVTVREVNQAPSLEPIVSRAVSGGSLVTFRAAATDSDLPFQALTFSLEPGAPLGAVIDPATGDFRWQIAEDVASTTNSIGIRVTDNGPGQLSALQVFTVVTEPRFAVVFSEVLRQPIAPNTQFIELFNRSTVTPWSLSGIRLMGSNLTYDFPSGLVLQPGARALVVQNLTAFRAAFGAGANVIGTWIGNLGSSSDSLVLVRPGSVGAPSVELERLDFGSGYPWAGPTSSSANSLQLVDPGEDRNRPGNWAVSTAFNGNRNLVGFLDSWRYFQDGPPPGGTNWRRPDFNDASWAQGGGALYVESAAIPTNKTTALALGQLTYYFRRTITLPALPADVEVQVRTLLDDGYVLWINGQRAHSLGMDDPAPTHDVVASRLVGDATIEGPFVIPASFFVPGQNTLAVEVHQNASGSSDIVFGLELTLVGGTAVPATPGLANNVTGDLPAFPTVRINEVLARNSTGLRDGTGTPEPWIELVNTGDEPTSLDGLYLSDSDAAPLRWAFPQGLTIPGHGYLTLFADGAPGASTPTEVHAGFRLASTAGTPIRLALSRVLGSGSTNAVDYFITRVGNQPDVATGRLPDGFVPSLADLIPTPDGPNRLFGINAPPVVGAPSDLTVVEGTAIDLNWPASDPDVPPQSLTFELISGPVGLSVSSAGRLTWTPEASGIGTNLVVVRAIDSGIPPLSGTNSFRIVVTPLAPEPPRFDPPILLADGRVRMQLLGTTGRRYRIETAIVLGQWSSLMEWTGSPGGFEIIGTPEDSGPSRFYRAVQISP